MNNNLLLELKPKYNLLSRLTFYFINATKSNQSTNIILVFALYILTFFCVVLMSFWGKDIDITLVFFVIFIIGICLLFLLFPLFRVFNDRKEFENYVFKIYEDRIEFVSAPSYLKRTTLNFSDIDEIVFSQNSFQKNNDLVSIEFISSKEHYEKLGYDHTHKNIIFFDVPNTQILHDILNKKFEEE